MSAERFRLAVFILIALTLAVGVGVGLWAVQWRYVTTAEGGLLRFNRFTGHEEIYACERGGRMIALGDFYIRPNMPCRWMQRDEGDPTSWWANVPAWTQWGILGVVLAVGVLALSRRGPLQTMHKTKAPNSTSTQSSPHSPGREAPQLARIKRFMERVESHPLGVAYTIRCQQCDFQEQTEWEIRMWLRAEEHVRRMPRHVAIATGRGACLMMLNPQKGLGGYVVTPGDHLSEYLETQ